MLWRTVNISRGKNDSFNRGYSIKRKMSKQPILLAYSVCKDPNGKELLAGIECLKVVEC